MTKHSKYIVFSIWFLLSILGLHISYHHWKAEYDFNKGLKLTAYKQYMEAIPHYNKAMERFPSEDFYRLYAAKNYLDLARSQYKTPSSVISNTKKAEKILLTLHNRDPLNPWYLLRLSETALILANYEPENQISHISQYGNYLKKASERDPNNPLFLQAYARYLFSNKQYDRAKPILEKVYAADKRMTDAAIMLGKIYQANSNYQLALPIFKRLYDKNKTSLENISNYAQSLYLNDQIEEAITLLMPYSSSDKSPFKLREFYAFLIYKIEDYTTAESLYLHLISEKEELFTLHQTLAEIYDRTGKIRKSRSIIKAYQQKYPSKEARDYYKELIAR